MSTAGDKARFFLEQSVPELQELERKKIFTKSEITSIAIKRSRFEHQVNARACRSFHYIRYAEYEINLESLRQKRAARLGIKTTKHSGQRRIFFVLDRATHKFPSDIGLWMQYITFARNQKSNKKVAEILTCLLRLHPTKPDVWIYAATYAIEERGDMSEARSYMQRGLRFCRGLGHFWIDYARLELLYIAKISRRRKILGLDDEEAANKQTYENERSIDGDMITLRYITAEDINPAEEVARNENQTAIEKLGKSPAMSGAIPIAIFEAAMAHFIGDENLAHQFFDMLTGFGGLPCQGTILAHIVRKIISITPNDSSALIRYIQQPVMGIIATSAEFPAALSVAIDRIEDASLMVNTTSNQSNLARQIFDWIVPLLDQEKLDLDVRKVLETMLRRTWDQYQIYSVSLKGEEGKAAEMAETLAELQTRGICNSHPEKSYVEEEVWSEKT